MEGCVFDNYQSFKVIMDLNIDIDEIIFVGGPSNSDLWCQVLSDVTNRKVITKHIPEASTLGDAITAGVGVGMFSNFEDVVDNVIKVKKVYAPDEKNHRLYEELYDLYIQVYSDSLESFRNMANIHKKHNILK